jgi:predicted DNA binding CopG/RHH family protein
MRDRQRTESITIRLTPQELEQIKAKQLQSGLSNVSEWSRLQLLKKEPVDGYR